MQNGSELTEVASFTHSLEYVAFPCPFVPLHLLTCFEYRWKDIKFEHRFRGYRHTALLVNWHCVNISGIPTRDSEKFFVRVPLWWADYDRNRLLVACKPTVFAYPSTLALLAEVRSRIFRIAVEEHFVSALLSIFRSALIGGLVDYIHVFEEATTLAESDV